jgi:hypothetical protein
MAIISDYSDIAELYESGTVPLTHRFAVTVKTMNKRLGMQATNMEEWMGRGKEHWRWVAEEGKVLMWKTREGTNTGIL